VLATFSAELFFSIFITKIKMGLAEGGEGEKLRFVIKQSIKTAHVDFRYQDNNKSCCFSTKYFQLR
jgi:hypothetical protein